MTTTTNPEKREDGKLSAILTPSVDQSNDILSLMGAVVRMSVIPQFLIDRSHSVIAWNRALEESTGISGEEISGTPRSWTAFYETKRPCLADLLVDDATKDLSIWYRDKWAESDCVERSYEAIDFFPRLGKKGKWLHFTAVPILDGNGVILGCIESFEDLTSLKMMERSFLLSQKKLHLMNNIVWHEIENKITSIRGYIEFSKEIVKNESCMKCFEAEENLLRKIHALLQFTRDYQKLGTQHPCWVNVGRAIQSVFSLMETGSLSMDAEAHALEIFGDPALEIMLAYLVKNTLANGKSAPEVRISFAEVKEGLQLTYGDNSAGIPLTRKNNLFKEEIVNASNFSLKLIHDTLEYSGMSIRETGDPDLGLRFEILIPKGAYRFNRAHC
ncbi:nitrogen regulation protein NR(II) [Methanoregula boonei]|nr:PAS domain-containing sensor histidine kinase [Methanoregula boonei]